jgi:hypothetical protein
MAIAKQAASSTQHCEAYLCINHAALQVLPCLIIPAALRDVESYRFESRTESRRLVNANKVAQIVLSTCLRPSVRYSLSLSATDRCFVCRQTRWHVLLIL